MIDQTKGSLVTGELISAYISVSLTLPVPALCWIKVFVYLFCFDKLDFM